MRYTLVNKRVDGNVHISVSWGHAGCGRQAGPSGTEIDRPEGPCCHQVDKNLFRPFWAHILPMLSVHGTFPAYVRPMWGHLMVEAMLEVYVASILKSRDSTSNMIQYSAPPETWKNSILES